MNLLDKYKSGQIKGPQTEEQTLAIWTEIKSSCDDIMNYLDGEKDHYSDDEALQYHEKIDIYGELVSKLCRVHVRSDVPYFDKQIEDFCLRCRKRIKIEDYKVHFGGANWVIEDKNGDIVGLQFSANLFKILKSILKKEEYSKNDIFLYYLAVKSEPGVMYSLKKIWTLNLFEIQNRA